MRSREPAKREVSRWGAVLAVVIAASVALLPSMAAAQDGTSDPYGPTSTTTTEPPDLTPVCALDLDQGVPGDRATAEVGNVPFGATVRILIGGEEAGEATAPAAFQGGTTSLTIEIEVPELEPGDYEVTAVGSGFNRSCEVGDGTTFTVLGTDDSDDSGFDVMAFTGINLLVYLLVAAALLLIGRRLVKMGKRRQSMA